MITTEVASSEAETHFGDLRRVREDGERFTVTVRGLPVAVLAPMEEPAYTKENIAELFEEMREFRARIAARGPILKPGETWNEYAREGLD